MPVYPRARTFDIVREILALKRQVTGLQTQAPGPTFTGDVWHPFNYQNGWTDSGFGPTGRYRLIGSPPNSIEILGDIAVPGTPNTLVATLNVDNNGVSTNYGVNNRQSIRFDIIASTGTSTVLSPVIACIGQPATLTASNIPSGTTRGFFHGFLSIDS